MNVLLALALLVQESPETAFQKIESAIEKAKSVRVLYTLMPANEPEHFSRGTLTLDGEATMKMSADLRNSDGSRVAVWSEYDGGKMRSSLAGHQIEVKVDARPVRQNFNMYLSRLGIFAGALFDHGFWTGSSNKGNALTADLKQLFGITSLVSLGEGKGGSKVLSYSFNTAFKPMPFRWSKIWYDPTTYRIIRREVCLEEKGKEQVLLEEYEIHLDDEKTAGPMKASTPPPLAARTEAEQDVLFIQARLQVANEHLQNGRKQKAIDVLEDLTLSFPKHPLTPEIRRLLEEAKKSK